MGYQCCQQPVFANNSASFQLGWQRRPVMFLLVGFLLPWTAAAFSRLNQPRINSHNLLVVSAKRSKRQQSKQDAEALDRWYESVDADASPDSVFWSEMERQQQDRTLLDQMQQQQQQQQKQQKTIEEGSFASTSTRPNTPTSAEDHISILKKNSVVALSQNDQPQSPKNIEATLTEYANFGVRDNWLNDDLVWMMETQQQSFEQDSKSLDEQLQEWEQEQDSDDFDGDDGAWMQSDEPWDHWGKSEDDIIQEGRSGLGRQASEFLLQESDPQQAQEEAARHERELLDRIRKLKIQSQRLERARNNAKAKAFFGRTPDASEGFDQLWVAAIDNACMKNLVGSFRDYGIQFADNFGDWEDGCLEDGMASIEDIASCKARKVYEVTKLPCIASRTSFEIEPIPERMTTERPAGRTAMLNTNPRVVSGYRFNDIGMHVEYLCDALRPISEPDRVTRFKTCLCYYDGEHELYEYGILDCDLIFANSVRAFVPISQAINEMLRKLELMFGLEFQKFLKQRMAEAVAGYGTATLKLRDRVLKEGRVLPNEIIDVSSFMDSQVDVNLMDECAKELSKRFTNQKPNKILTVATTGLVIALPMARYLQVPVVYARKERNVVMSDTFKAAFQSKTVGKNRELIVSKSHLDPDDRILIVDDFLSSGSSQEALLRIVSDAGATVVGIGVLLEKAYESGRQSLSGFDIPIESLCRVASVNSGVIQLLEEEGFDNSIINNNS